jgi:trigger factor
MKVTIENIKGLNKDLKVLIDKETMNSYMDEKYEEIKGTVNLKGFRPGKVPKEVLKRQFGKAVFGEGFRQSFKRNFYKSIRRK